MKKKQSTMKKHPKNQFEIDNINRLPISGHFATNNVQNWGRKLQASKHTASHLQNIFLTHIATCNRTSQLTSCRGTSAGHALFKILDAPLWRKKLGLVPQCHYLLCVVNCFSLTANLPTKSKILVEQQLWQLNRVKKEKFGFIIIIIGEFLFLKLDQLSYFRSYTRYKGSLFWTCRKILQCSSHILCPEYFCKNSRKTTTISNKREALPWNYHLSR